MVKSGSDGSDPKVRQAVAAIRGAVERKGGYGTPVNYNVAVSIIFLLELDPITYRSETQALLDVLLSRQESHGGWSYWPNEGSHTRQEGDSSMTQYATLALWGAKRARFDVPQEACARVANFWIRTQTPQGAWGYQGHLAPPGQRIPQNDVRPSITVGGLGSCYAIGELFGLAKREGDEQPRISNALQKVQQTNAASRYFPAQNLDLSQLRQTISLGDRYVEQTHRGYEGVNHKVSWLAVFLLYSMERYRSFQEHYQGTASDPGWYDEGVEYLEKMQKSDGSWIFGRSGAVETSFAILFLTRSTKKSIAREFGEGLVRGGRGLPADIGQVVIDEATGAVVNPEATETVQQLLAVLEDPSNSNLLAMASKPRCWCVPLRTKMKSPARSGFKVLKIWFLQAPTSSGLSR
jgi:hypothetical protein